MTVTTLQIVLAGAAAATIYNLVTLALACFIFYTAGDRLDWERVLFRALVSAVIGGWVGLFIAIIVQITF